MRGRFVGREREVEELKAVLAAAVTEEAQNAGLVIGAPGSGKSRLLAEIADRAQVRVLRITGYEPEQAVPLTAARDLLKELSRSPRQGSGLETVAFGSEAWGETATPLRLFEAAYQCLAERSPVLIAIDDLQWVDDVSVALVTYLVRASIADGTPIALLAVGRPSARAGTLRDALAAMLPDEALHELELAPLSESAGVALVRDLAPRTATDDARRIWERAGGSPFWIEALALN